MLRIIALGLLVGLPLASAGSADAPELTDPQGDAVCFGPAGNEYADIVSAWIDGETETAFMVNIALAKWTVDPLGTASGYTLQFTHQGVQFGAIAAYVPAPVGEGWEFDNGHIDTQTGQVGEFVDAEGTFTPGSPAILSIVFSKSMFPHGDTTDNKLVGFTGGSADFKNWAPFFFAPIEPPTPFQLCDGIVSDAEYVFQTGGHSQHMSSATAEEAEDPDSTSDTAPTPATGTSVKPAATNDADTPFAPLGAALVVVALAAFARKRR